MTTTRLPGKSVLQRRSKIIGIALLCAAFGSEALTLGRVRGAALVGQPLNLVIEAQIGAGETAAALCFEADVFHADTRQDASRVRVLTEATAQAQTVNVRVLSSAIVDEPVVTVYLRTGCGQKTTRRYVLLADMPSEVAAASTLFVPPVAAVTAPAPAPPSPDVAISTGQAQAVRAAEDSGQPRVVKQRPKVKPGVAPSKRATPDAPGKTGRAPGQARLKLDPLEFLSDRIANLAPPTPVATPEEILQQQRIQTLEGSVKALLAAAAKSEASLVDLKTRLQKAESERFSGPVVYGLIVLLLACLGALALLWSRQRHLPTQGGEWWSGSIMPSNAELTPAPEPLPEPLTDVRKHDETGSSHPPDTAVASESAPDSTSSSAVDVDLVDMSDSFFDNLVQAGPAQGTSRQPPPSPAPTPARHRGPQRDLHSEEILDIRQQADFFVSLGKAEQGLRILKRQVHESEEPNPSVYLDLLGIVHALSLKSEFQQWRESFNRLFSGLVPEFAFFKQESRDLTSYPDVLAHITALWPTVKAVELIESCIFRDTREAEGQSFELEAFRDLLLLHGVAQRAALAPDPLAADAGVSAEPAAFAAAAPDSALDLDLSEFPSEDMDSPATSTAHVDLPLLMRNEPDADTDGDAKPPLASSNLIDFDLTAAAPLPGPGATKPP